MPINIAQVKVQVLANSNGTFAEPLTNAFKPDPYFPVQPQIAINLSATSQEIDSLAGITPIPGMLYATSIALSSEMTATSLTIKNVDPIQTIWLKFKLAPSSTVGTDPLSIFPIVTIPLLGGGIVTLSTPIDPTFLLFFTPAIGMSVDCIIVGKYPA